MTHGRRHILRQSVAFGYSPDTGVFALAAGVTSVIAVAYHRERSIVNWAIILLGLFVSRLSLARCWLRTSDSREPIEQVAEFAYWYTSR
jgi:hypothetical protein